MFDDVRSKQFDRKKIFDNLLSGSDFFFFFSSCEVTVEFFDSVRTTGAVAITPVRTTGAVAVAQPLSRHHVHRASILVTKPLVGMPS